MVCGKADALTGAFRSLVLNVNGPIGSVRRIYYGVWEPAVLYGPRVVKIKKKRNILKRPQRAALIRVSRPYRTVSLCVLIYGHYAHLFHS